MPGVDSVLKSLPAEENDESSENCKMALFDMFMKFVCFNTGIYY